MRRGDENGARRRWVSVAAWVAALLGWAWALVVWSPMVLAERASRGAVGDWCWAVDVLASLASQSAAVVLCVVGLMLAAGRWRAACVAGLSAAAVAALPMSEPRLARADGAGGAVRVLAYNAKTGSGSLEAKGELVRGAEADVVVLLEPPLEWVELYLAGGGGLEGYETGWRPSGAWSGCPLLLSRHAVDAHGGEEGLALRGVRRRLWDHFYRLEIVRTPAGGVAVVQAHARSPRSARRWRAGLEQLLMLADSVREIGEITGLPVVVAGDFNSPPTGLRARAFALRSGLVRAKPALAAGGTFPSWLPAWGGVAIDGVYASPGARVVSWRVIGSAGSDHRAVVVDLVLDQVSVGSEP